MIEDDSTLEEWHAQLKIAREDVTFKRIKVNNIPSRDLILT